MTYYNIDVSPKETVLYGESVNDLTKMPTTKTPGIDEYKDLGCVEVGTIAQILLSDSIKFYMLNSNGWVEITDTYRMDIL